MKIEIGGDGSGCLFVGQVFNMTTDQLIIGVSGSWGVGRGGGGWNRRQLTVSSIGTILVSS